MNFGSSVDSVRHTTAGVTKVLGPVCLPKRSLVKKKVSSAHYPDSSSSLQYVYIKHWPPYDDFHCPSQLLDPNAQVFEY